MLPSIACIESRLKDMGLFGVHIKDLCKVLISTLNKLLQIDK